MSRFALSCVLVSAATLLSAQDQPAPEVLQRQAFVRRISVGATLTVPVWNGFKPGSAGLVTTPPPTQTTIDGATRYHWGGGGLMLQFAILERVSVNLNAFYHKNEFNLHREDLVGVDNPNTPQDDRTLTTYDIWTRVRYLDLPVLARVYNKGRHRKGARMFVEGGPNVRVVRKLLTTIVTTLPDGNAKWTSSPLPPFKRNVFGLTAGAGGQIIDPVGVRLIPEVRYTRWLGSSFDMLGVTTRKNELSILFSLAF